MSVPICHPENPPLRIPIQEADSGSLLGSHLLRAALSGPSSRIQLKRCIGTCIFHPRSSEISAVLAIVFGMLVSRWLSAPLTHLVDGTQAIARRDLSFRVAEQGSAEMREVSNSFNRMAAALENAETLRRSMLNDIAHELRTPLTVLEGNLRAILDDVYPLEKAEIARLYDQTRHLHRLVDDLRLLAQAEARQLPLQRSPSDLVVLLEEVAELFSPLAGEKSISLNTSLLPSSVFAAVIRFCCRRPHAARPNFAESPDKRIATHAGWWGHHAVIAGDGRDGHDYCSR